MSGIDDDPPQEVGRLLEGLFRKKRREPALAVNRLRQSWPGIVGEALARVTWPARIARGVLWITAIDTGWAFNLQFVKADILNAVRTYLGSPDIREIRYKAGAVPGGEAQRTSGTGPGDDAGAATSASQPVPARAEAPPPTGPELSARPPGSGPPEPVGSASAPPIADPALRERFLRAAARLRARRRSHDSNQEADAPAEAADEDVRS